MSALADGLGWLAAALVLLAFCMRDMRALRGTAVASNLAFIAYGAAAQIDPVLMLHLVLLPLNAARLLQARREPAQPDTVATSAGSAPSSPRSQRH